MWILYTFALRTLSSRSRDLNQLCFIRNKNCHILFDHSILSRYSLGPKIPECAPSTENGSLRHSHHAHLSVTQIICLSLLQYTSGDIIEWRVKCLPPRPAIKSSRPPGPEQCRGMHPSPLSQPITKACPRMDRCLLSTG